ncbi:hypothetical protein BDF20DRAFT_853878 [Mycotypha africana]|uniref:uncharacterized protein n=1 Tax=Mycotypha africana TaxID=64632 RepID=UPI002301E61B|nr:uncharacterized protein BDF20DRAFT_853878 [Mycotypha africana]KAI8988113.1 hypothetical protein BDF20DRAFT_853878 [Mycotypha africana]
MASTPDILKFTQLHSAVDAAFWQSFVSKKLNDLKLSSEPLDIQGYFTQLHPKALDEHGKVVPLPSRFQIPSYGLEMETLETTTTGQFPSKGTLVNTNTMEEFRLIDKNQLFQQVADKIKNAVESGDALKDNSLLNSFLMLMFADLKHHKFYYWFAFPAMMPQPEPWRLLSQDKHYFTQKQLDDIDEAYQALSRNASLSSRPSPYFWIKQETGELQVAPLCDYDRFYENHQNDCVLGFFDPSTANESPGWPLRNVLYLVQTTWHLKRLKVLCYRQQQQQQQQTSSFVIDIELPNTSFYRNDIPSVGWERNVQGKLGPRLADLGPLMDPIRLSEQYGDLNLKLMRWRLLPDLDLEKIKQTKCLLFGAGTLGCYVARSLIAWGVRHITFVDNGKVSLSNPVRQPLYSFQDAIDGKHTKAETAAANLKDIHPTVVSSGYCLDIPMPGHAMKDDDEQLLKDIHRITQLIEEHDVIFLLTDSRESRWYPTLVASMLNKLTINSALGFDTYLVMRHGSRRRHHQTPSSLEQPQQQNLGCYFCNDVVAPTDSLTDRTLDQQCTVTRPGLSAIAAGLAVELMVSVLQHPDGMDAKADTLNNASSPANQQSSLLGLLPHQIRGFLGQFRNLLIVGQAYENCTACSEKVLSAYEKDPLNFMKKVLQDSLYLEQVTGLQKMKEESEALFHDWDNIEDEEDDF